ncbi:MAG: hypothetical protein LAP38_11045 [Acidobacteriia bacterium]|nr:hypothetical protein [Terriglobia bacterium]
MKAALEALHFGSTSSFNFGARPRDFGYWPRTTEEVQHWFSVSLKLVETLACGDEPVGPQARAALAEKFRGLWLRGGVPDEIANVCRVIRKIRFWPEGWLAVRQALDLDAKGLDEERRAKLVALEAELRPADLAQKVRAVVFSTRLQGVDLDDFEDHTSEDITTRMARTEALAQDLGKAVATEETLLAELLPEIVTNDGRLWSFGQGLLAGASDAEEMWNRLVATLAGTQERARKPQVLGGFLHQLRVSNPALATKLLDSAVEHETLAGLYPILQVSVNLEEQDVARLKRSVALGKAPAAMYQYLAYGRATDPIPAPDFQELVLAIAAMQSGYDVAIEILDMRLHSDKDRQEGIAPELVDAGCDLMRQFTFAKNNVQAYREDYRLGDITKSCLKGEKGAAVTMEICHKLKCAVAKYDTSTIYHDDLLVGIFGAQPTAALDGLCGGDQKELEQGISILQDVDARKHPLTVVSDEDLLNWCDKEPQTRYPAIAQVIAISQRQQDNMPPQWTSIALRFLEKAPAPDAVLHQFVSQFEPSGGWSGSLAAVLESKVALLDQLAAYPDLSAAVAQQKERLRKSIEEQHRRETAWDRQRDERFE